MRAQPYELVAIGAGTAAKKAGIAWETFHTLNSVPVYGEDTHLSVESARCCAA